MSSSEIKNFYENETVFITGGTGFIGKLVIEKLLRVCQPKKIILIVRSKKGKSIEERIDDFFNYACFDRLKNEIKDYKRKVCFIAGDCEVDKLGISEEDEEALIRDTTTVFHVAANVKFDQPLRSAANANVKSTINILTLTKKMPLLKAFVYVSTAYSNCTYIHTEIKEDFYTPPMAYKNLLALLDAIDDTTLEQITTKLLGKWPNTYIFSKSISENVVKTVGKDLPIAIVRPAIVVNTYAEPMPGWVDKLQGLLGIGLAAGLGIIRTVRAFDDIILYLVPADFVANLILAAAWNTENQKQATIYNFVGHKSSLRTVSYFEKLTRALYFFVPPERLLWVYTFTLRQNKLWNDICVLFLHTLPAYIIDFLLFCLGKPRIAVKGYRKLNKMLKLLSYYATQNWFFQDKNVMALWEKLTDEDKKLFSFDMENINWSKMTRISLDGVCSYLLKVPALEHPKLTMKHVFLYMAHYTVIFLFWFSVYKLIRFFFGMLM